MQLDLRLPSQVSPHFRSAAPEHESWSVQGARFPSTRDLVDGFASREPVSATYSFTHRKPAFRDTETLALASVLGGGAGFIAAAMTGLEGLAALGAIGGALAVGAGLGMLRNLPGTHSGTIEGKLVGKGADLEPESRDPHGVGNMGGDMVWVPPSEQEVARAKAARDRSVPLAEYARAERVEGNPVEAEQWWNSHYGPPYSGFSK